MDEHEEFERRPRRAPNAAQGVRIIGAEEAAAALEAGEAAGRRPLDEPRFGDRPQPPQGPRPAHRFPLPESVDPAEVVRGRPHREEIDGPAQRGPSPRSTRVPERTEEMPAADPPTSRAEPSPEIERGPEMLHWSEPATGEVPRIFVGDPDPEPEPEDDLAAWATLPGRGPSWRGDNQADWEADEYEPSVLADDETRVGALDPHLSEESDLYSFDVLDETTGPTKPAVDEEGLFDRTTFAGATRRQTRAGRRGANGQGGGDGRAGGRDLRVAVATGIAAGIAALILFKLGPVTALLLSLVVVTLAAAEAFAVIRRAGYRPATLLGLAATVALMVATYLKGETAIPLIVALTVIFSMLWYLGGVVKARPTINVATTLLGFVWVGVLGSFAGLLLDPTVFPNRHGVAFLLGACLAAVAYDIGGYAIGRIGHRPLAPAISPKKTWEGLIGGMAASFLVSVVIVGQIHPWSIKRAALLGLVVAVVAPLGDLCQSMIKRDIGVKDMGSLLPGHGGVLDRVDAILFVLPATYYLLRLLNAG